MRTAQGEALSMLPTTHGTIHTMRTAQGEVLFMLLTSASEKQWRTSEPILRKVADSFRA